MNEDKFDDSIKQKADNHAAPVPQDAWDNITKKKKKNPYPVFWWSLSSLLIAAGIFLYFNATEKHSFTSINQHNQLNQTISTPNNNFNKEIDKTNNRTATNNSLQNNVSSTNNKTTNEKQYTALSNNTDLINANNTTAKYSTNRKTLQDNTSVTIKNKDVPTAYNNRILKKYRTGPKIKFKTTSGEPSSDTETAEQNVDNSGKDKNILNANNDNVNSEEIISEKNDSSSHNNNKIIAISTAKPLIDSSTKTTKKDVALKKPDKKTQKNSNAGKSIKIPVLIFDFSIMPFSPIQHYTMPLYVKRNTIVNGVNTVYTTNSIKTALLFSTAFSFEIRKNISKKILAGIGLQYEQITENITLSGIDSTTNYSTIQRLQLNNAGPYLANDTIATTTTGTRIISAVNSYLLCSIPVFVQYMLINHPSFSLAITGGAYFTVSAKYNNSITGKLEPVYESGIQTANEKNNLATDIFGAVRFSKLLHKNLLLFAEPTFRYNINAYKLNNVFLNKNINQEGISVGLSYKIF